MSYHVGQFETMMLPDQSGQTALPVPASTPAPAPAAKASMVPKLLLGGAALIALASLVKK